MTEVLEETLEVAPPQPSANTELIRVDSDEQLAPALARLVEPIVAFDTETTGLDPLSDRLLLLQFSNGISNIVIDMTRVTDWAQIREFMSSRDRLFVAHNAKFDYSWLATKLESEDITPRLFCTMVTEQLLTAGTNLRVGLKDVVDRYFKIKMDKEQRATFIGMTGPVDFTDEQLIYAAKDVEILPKLFSRQAQRLKNTKMIEIAQVEFTLIKVISRMERRGVLIDTVEWTRVVDQAKVRCDELEREMQVLAGNEKFNPRSAKQVAEAFRQYGFVLAKTDAGTLEKLDHPLAKAMLEYRKAVVLRDRYGDMWLARLGLDNRVRAQFKQLGAATGRFSSSDPNLQQLPRGDLLRKAFIAGPGRKMITADYSQIEVRILAELSKDENMIKLFKEGHDIHSATAQQMFKLDAVPDKDSTYRQMAKSVNFGLIYGAGADNLAGQLSAQGVHVSRGEAENLIRLYFSAFPKAQRWLDGISRSAYNSIEEEINVESRTLGGRVRVFEVSPRLSGYERGHIARQARNTPIQGSSADITKEAMNRLDQEFREHPEWDAHLLMTVHDELVVESLEAYAQTVAETTERCMIEGAERYMKLCPVKVDWKIADSWQK